MCLHHAGHKERLLVAKVGNVTQYLVLFWRIQARFPGIRVLEGQIGLDVVLRGIAIETRSDLDNLPFLKAVLLPAVEHQRHVGCGIIVEFEVGIVVVGVQYGHDIWESHGAGMWLCVVVETGAR